MEQILIVDVSPRGPESASRKVTRKLEERLKVEYPSAEIIHRDLVSDSLPHLDGVTLKAIPTKDAAEAQKLKRSASLSDKLTDELLGSDLLVMQRQRGISAFLPRLKRGLILLFVPA